MKELAIPLLLLCTFVITACKQTLPAIGHETVEQPNMEPMGKNEDMTVHDRSTGSGIAFTIEKNGALVSEYGISHTKEMHLVVVRDDLENFQHLHPARDGSGTWKASPALLAPGTYWLFADFADPSGKPHVLRFQRDVPGDMEMNGFQLHPGKAVKDTDGYEGQEKTVDGYRIQVSTLTSADMVTFTYHVLDRAGNPVALEEYLGEKGHSILLSREGDFLHTHPLKDYVGYKESDAPVFAVHTDGLQDSFYRIFTQFKINGKVVVTAFDWQR